jgi:hypothetical protein
MPKKSRRKELSGSKDRMLTMYPPHAEREKGMVKSIIKKLIHIRKGH